MPTMACGSGSTLPIDVSLPIDLDISRYKKIGLTSSSPGGRPAGKQLVHLGDGVCFEPDAANCAFVAPEARTDEPR